MASGIWEKPYFPNGQSITWGTPVQLNSYSSASNPFTCPHDGFVRISAQGSGAYAAIHVVGLSYNFSQAVSYGSLTQMNTVPVFAGMQIWIESVGTSASYYFPIE